MDALQRRLKAIGEAQPLLRALQFSTIHEAQALVPRKTGHLQRSIVPGQLTTSSAVVEARTPYAGYVEHGTRAHIIKPKNAKALAWGGERRLTGKLKSGSSPTHFAKVVHHPGTKAEPYLVPGAKRAIHKAGVDKIVQAWNDAA